MPGTATVIDRPETRDTSDVPDRYARHFTLPPTPRVERLRAYYQGLRPVLRIDLDRIMARVMRSTEGEPMILRRAKAFAAVVREVPIEVYPDEPFVGWVASEPAAVSIVAHERGAWLEPRLDKLKKLTDEQRQILAEEILPHWKGDGDWTRTRAGYTGSRIPEELHRRMWPGVEPTGVLPFTPVMESGIQCGMHTSHVGHATYGYEKVLEKGLLGVKKEAKDRLASLNRAEEGQEEKVEFLEAAVIALEAAAEIGGRFAARARELADEESDAVRVGELLEIAEICDRVPAQPARTFHEALQSAWFTHILNWFETPGIGGVSPGRVDQYFYRFYEHDTASGALSRERAQELVDCWLMRFDQDAARLTADSGGVSHHIDLGGLRPEGGDATNELSFIFLEGMMHVRPAEPNLAVLVHSMTPEDFLIRACELCSMGTGHPSFINHDSTVLSLLARGHFGGPLVPLELARESGIIGCNEPSVVNADAGFISGGGVALPVALEHVLHNGRSPLHDEPLGLETGDPRSFTAFDELREAFHKQLADMVARVAQANRLGEQALAEVHPTAYQSALIDGCVENATSREAGGARFNFGPVIGAIGVVDVGDSLAAIKKLVFDEQRITMDELVAALDADFEGHEGMRRVLLAAPKFGNDDDFADEQSAWVQTVYCDEVIQHENTRGGHMLPGQIPLAYYVPVGTGVGALPSGRKAREPLSDGICPTRGNDVTGPTAIINSVAKLDNVRMFLGQTLNLRLTPELFRVEFGVKRLADLVRTLVDSKLHHVQINVVDAATLRAAQEKPDEHRDLLVRVAGYVTFFVLLSKPVQDAIISRTEHGM
jgi:formate C-acetyltransferase